MCGSFSSEQQALTDSSYFDIRLEMVPIWNEREDGAWLYVEQAVASALERPYRQRVYHVVEIEVGVFSSRVYSFPDPLQYAGDWNSPTPLSGLTPDDLEMREGCAVWLQRDFSGEFSGSTIGRSCVSNLHGAVYATSEVVIAPDRIESWDRGFDAEGEQIWGAENGGYIFVRQNRE
jgi:hypothetical protein